MEPGEHPITERVAGERGRVAASRVGLAVVIALGAAVLKPWDPVGDDPVPVPAQQSARADQPRSSARPVKRAVADDAVADICLRPLGWRIIATEIWVDRTARTWKAVEAVEASGPDDPTIPIVFVTGESVPALGWCAPVVGPDIPPAEARATIWSIGSQRPLRIATRLLEPREPGSGGGMWAPPDAEAMPTARPESWPIGRYVIRIATPDGRFERWLGAEVLPPARQRAAAPPVAQPGSAFGS